MRLGRQLCLLGMVQGHSNFLEQQGLASLLAFGMHKELFPWSSRILDVAFEAFIAQNLLVTPAFALAPKPPPPPLPLQHRLMQQEQQLQLGIVLGEGPL